MTINLLNVLRKTIEDKYSLLKQNILKNINYIHDIYTIIANFGDLKRMITYYEYYNQFMKIQCMFLTRYSPWYYNERHNTVHLQCLPLVQNLNNKMNQFGLTEFSNNAWSKIIKCDICNFSSTFFCRAINNQKKHWKIKYCEQELKKHILSKQHFNNWYYKKHKMYQMTSNKICW